MHVEPVSPYPPAVSRSLDEWLSERLSRGTPPEFATRLRVIAAQQAARVAACAAFAGLGISLALAGIVLAAYGAPLAGPVVMIAAGAALAVGCLLPVRRFQARIPREGATTTTRGPGSARGGMFAAGAVLVLFTALSSPAWLRDPNLLWVNAGMAALLISALVVPAAVLGRGRESLRRRAQSRGPLRDALEQERLGFVPSPGTQAFGPL